MSIDYNSDVDFNKKTTAFDLIIDVFPNANQKIVVSGKGHVNNVGESGFAALAIIDVKSAVSIIFTKKT